ncbi:YlbD family protein [Salicibibacter cibi]|uniref:YlbD family protein n=1 Tax=Salicibibacter cibi TaxID=2743001 RepID=A0A7T6ZBY6_9BACI|nr:YlbD family protein [Salicibibacter cibi]QQK80638.1 YlbD family protein [Salicibibacter cibi]
MENDGQLDPSLRDFKAFVKQHPKLVQEVRSGKATWNGLYQDWVILGDDEQHWSTYAGNPSEADSSDTNSTEMMPSIQGLFQSNQTVGTLLKTLGQMNVNDLQKHLSQFNGVMGNVQELLSQFQSNPNQSRNDRQENPFSFRGF